MKIITKKVIAREFLWLLSSAVIFFIILFLWLYLHDRNIKKVEKIDLELSSISNFEPHSSLVEFENKFSNKDIKDLDLYISSDSVLSKYNKKALLDYVAIVNSRKYKNYREINSKFKIFGFDDEGFHDNFKKHDFVLMKQKKYELDKIKKSFFNNNINEEDIFGLLIIILTISFGLRYVFYATKWSIKQLKEDS